MALLIEDLELVAGDRLAAGARPEIVETVGAVDVQHLGRTDAIEDCQAESVLPATPYLGRECLGGGNAVAYRREVATLGAFEVQDRVVERRCREEQRWTSLL